jgi:hypothetical protein
MQAPVERTLHAKATVVPGTESASSCRTTRKIALGGLTDDPEMLVEGKIDKATGKIQNALGKAERKLDDEEDDR